jgi:hypothetical protein
VSDHDDFAFEPIPGLPADLPEGETILWQGTPRWLGLAKHALRLPLVALYCAILLAWVAASRYAESGSIVDAVLTLAWPVVLVAALFAILLALGYRLARSTIYTITTRRVVMRFGLVLPITINLPFRQIAAAALKTHGDGSGDIPLTLKGKDKIAWLHLWPHARPLRFSKPEPMLRDVPEVEQVAALLAEAMAEELPEGRATLPQTAKRQVSAAARRGLATA